MHFKKSQAEHSLLEMRPSGFAVAVTSLLEEDHDKIVSRVVLLQPPLCDHTAL